MCMHNTQLRITSNMDTAKGDLYTFQLEKCINVRSQCYNNYEYFNICRANATMPMLQSKVEPSVSTMYKILLIH